MIENNNSGGIAPSKPNGTWRSRPRNYLIAALVLSALLLGYEYRAVIFAGSISLWLPLLLCMGMHFFMHRGHGGHGGHGQEKRSAGDDIDSGEQGS